MKPTRLFDAHPMMPLLFLLLFLPPLTGCGNMLYLSKLGWHQALISVRSVPVQEVLTDEKTDREMKEKIRFIQEVKGYGEERLGLKETKNYSSLYRSKGPVLFVVSASCRDRLTPYNWSFPLVGKVTYKGFFTREDALKEGKRLEEEGFDAFVRPAYAYSTLGWLRDPIFSPMLGWDEPTLANLILHELTHATVYFKGKTEWNEQVATFVGNQGAVDFLTARYGPASPQAEGAVHAYQDDLLFGSWIDRAYGRLSRFYDLPISREDKIRGREEIFRSLKQEYEKIRGDFKTEPFRRFEKIVLNNAVILAYYKYFHGLKKFEGLFERLGGDLRRVVEFFREKQDSPGEVAAWMEQDGEPPAR